MLCLFVHRLLLGCRNRQNKIFGSLIYLNENRDYVGLINDNVYVRCISLTLLNIASHIKDTQDIFILDLYSECCYFIQVRVSNSNQILLTLKIRKLFSLYTCWLIFLEWRLTYWNINKLVQSNCENHFFCPINFSVTFWHEAAISTLKNRLVNTFGKK